MNSASAVTDYLTAATSRAFNATDALLELADNTIVKTLFNYTPRFAGKIVEIRAMGYDSRSGHLEFTDNSVSKGATFVKTYCHRKGGAGKSANLLDRLTIRDDASGMTFAKLNEAFVFNFLKEERDETDIGKFHVGMKYAAMSMANSITIISRSKGQFCAALYADVDTMRKLDSWEPTEVEANANSEWILRHIPYPSLVAEFLAQPSGTLIHLAHLEPMCVRDTGKMLSELHMNMQLAYASVPGNCQLELYDDLALKKTASPLDLFYKDNEAALDEKPYETTLFVYSQGPGEADAVYERCRVRRERSGTRKDYLEPGYYEYFDNDNNRTEDGAIISRSGLPEEKGHVKLIGKIHIRMIQTSKETDDEETEMTEDSDLLIKEDRKGFWFNRGIRMVGAAKRLTRKFHDRSYSGCNERQRMLITFEPKLDEQLGSRFNKQMDDNRLPCAALHSAVWLIYRQVTKPWSRKSDQAKEEEVKQKKLEAQRELEEESEDEEEETKSEVDDEESDEESDDEEEPPKKPTLSNAIIVPKPQPIVPVPVPDKPKPFSMEDLKKDEEESDEEDEEEPPAKPAPPPQPTQSVALKGQTIQLLNGSSLTSEVTTLPHADKFFNWIQLVNCGPSISESQRSQIHAMLARLVK